MKFDRKNVVHLLGLAMISAVITGIGTDIHIAIIVIPGIVGLLVSFIMIVIQLD